MGWVDARGLADDVGAGRAEQVVGEVVGAARGRAQLDGLDPIPVLARELADEGEGRVADCRVFAWAGRFA